jgi:arsenite oxidase small subunit
MIHAAKTEPEEDRWQHPCMDAAAKPLSRRQFGGSLTRAGISAWATAVAFWLTGCFSKKYRPEVIAKADEIPIGGSKIFQYPTENNPCILVRTGTDAWVAYSRICTHLSCAIFYNQEQQTFICPCHQGIYAVADGTVLAGPPPRPLPRIVIEQRGQDLVAVGVQTREAAS